MVAGALLLSFTAQAQLGEPQDWVKSAAYGWSNAIAPQAGAAAQYAQTNTTRLDIPSDTRSIALQFSGYLNAPTTAATNVTINIRRSVSPVGNANGTWLTAHKALTNTVDFMTWSVVIPAGSSRAFDCTNLSMTLGSGQSWYPHLYVQSLGLGYSDAAYLTNFTLKAKFQRDRD